VPLSASQELLATPAEGSSSNGPAAQRETSFTLLSSSSSNNNTSSSAARGNRGNYASLPTTESSRPSPPSQQATRSRYASSSLASSRSDLVSESKSTEPLLPASPTSGAVLDLDGIPPPPRPYQGPAPPPLPPPPPHPYSDRTLPLNAAQLRGLHHHHPPPPPPPGSYANIGMQSSSTSSGQAGKQPRDVMIHAGKKNNFSTSEISV
jgi:hypothetical protein